MLVLRLPSSGRACHSFRSARFRSSRSHPSLTARASTAKVSKTDLLNVAEEAANAAKLVILDALDKPRSISNKTSSADIVTETDKAAEEACLAVVRRAFGTSHAILGEEGGLTGDPTSDYLWCIDPLDGTTNFAHGYPSFAVSVGVLRHAIPVAACVIEFSGGPGTWVTRTYKATRNGGATCNGTPLCVSRTKELSSALMVAGFGYQHDEPWLATMELFQYFTDNTRGVRRLGAAAVDLCHVAAGMSDAYFEFRLKPWDTCAGVLMVEEAGGRVTTMDGRAYSVFERSLLASNDALYDSILEVIEPKTTALVEGGADFSPWFIPEGYMVHTGRQL